MTARRFNIDFMRWARLAMTISAVIIVAGIVAMALPGRGLKLGIDFTGGTLLDLRFERAVSTGEVRRALEPFGLGNSVIKLAGAEGKEVLITTRPIPDETRNGVLEGLKSSLGPYEPVRVEEVKGAISAELTRKAYLATIIACAGMLLYITLRFQLGFGLAAVLALVHDVLVTLSVFAIGGIEIDSTFVAAILTIIGYSINDTIVVFDRIRENLRGAGVRQAPPEVVVNDSVNSTLGRSINTSLTTLLAILAVLFFGGKTTRNFALALTVGIVSGTYSSIFIASPIWVYWQKRAEKRSKARRLAGLQARERDKGKKAGKSKLGGHMAGTRARP